MMIRYYSFVGENLSQHYTAARVNNCTIPDHLTLEFTMQSNNLQQKIFSLLHNNLSSQF